MTESKEKQTRSNRYNKENSQKEIKNIKNNVSDKDIEKEHTLIKKILIIALIVIIIFISYSCFIGTSIIDIKEYKVESSILPDSFHGFKIVQFSDIHYGTTINKKQLDKIVSKINNLKPDIIVFTGNLFDKNISINDDIKNEVIDSLSNLECNLYKYAIYGNEDYSNDMYKEIISAIDFTLLDNESILLYYKETTPIEIVGFNSIETNSDYTILTNSVDEVDTSNLFKLVLSHEPDSISKIINYNPNLVLSGHSLGGLINIPFIKPIFLPNNAKEYYEEYYKLNNTDFYISNGLGTSGINARFNNHPSISLYRLYKETESN